MTINEFNFAGKKAIVRVDFNVPLDENGKITSSLWVRSARLLRRHWVCPLLLHLTAQRLLTLPRP